MKDAFLTRLNSVLSQIDAQQLHYNENERGFFDEEFQRMDAYFCEHELLNAAIALRAARALHSGLYRGRAALPDGTQVPKPYFCHCLSVCRMLINLPLPLTLQEKDIMLAAALCHDVPAYVQQMHHSDALVRVYHLDPAVLDLVTLIFTRDCVTDEDFRTLFRNVSRNRLAVLIKLADRGHVVEGLYNVSVWRANEYIQETRTYYIPMCIYAREDYPELDRALGILQEKLRDLIEATEIFLIRYADLERELTTQILQLEEDNAHMRTRIRKAKSRAESM